MPYENPRCLSLRRVPFITFCTLRFSAVAASWRALTKERDRGRLTNTLFTTFGSRFKEARQCRIERTYKKNDEREFKYSNYILFRDSILSKHDRFSSEDLLL